MEKERKKYPIGAENFTLYEKVGTGASASVYRALCKPHNEIVSIKVLDFERSNTDLDNISREAQTMILVDHPNVLKSHCSFITDHNLWVVMPYMAGGSCLHILKLAHQDGFEEVVIATILREVLKGLEYLHENGHIHRDVKAGNILIDSRGGIKLGDFGVSAYLFDGGDRQRIRNTFVGTPCWMAPEVMEQSHGYDFKADVWSFGITALELAHGHAPFSKYPPMKVLLMTLQNAPPGLDYERDKKFSKSFRQMIASCLEKDPSKRPTARKLLKHSFFRKARSNDYIARHLLEGLPALGDRLKAIKKKDEEMLAQKKMPDGEKEEISQNIYKRGISAWDFNLEDIRAQAALIQDDDSVVEQDDDTPTKQLQHQSSFTMERSSDASEYNAPTSVSSVDSTTNIAKCEKSNGEARIPGSTTEARTTNMVLGNGNLAANRSVENPASEVNRKSAGSQIGPNKEEKAQNQSQNLSHDGLLILQKSDCAQLEIPSKGSKASANDNEVDEKAKNPVVQQKGRFKVTSENIENEKVVPCPVMPKSHNMQVTAPNPAASLQSPLEATPSSPSGHSVFPLLQSILQANVLQRDFILRVMKQVSNDSSGCLPMNAAMTEISLVEAANDREKELLNEINDLKRRLGCALEEVQKYKKDNARENST